MKHEKFGTSPVSDAYFKVLDEQDKLIRDMLLSSACKIEEVPFEEFEGIAVDMSGEEPIYSKGWKDFFSYKIE